MEELSWAESALGLEYVRSPSPVDENAARWRGVAVTRRWRDGENEALNARASVGGSLSKDPRRIFAESPSHLSLL